MKASSKYLFISLKERNGDYEYTHKNITEINNEKISTAIEVVEDYAKTFYMDNPEKCDNGYYFFGGEVFVSVNYWTFISEEEYNVLKNLFSYIPLR